MRFSDAPPKQTEASWLQQLIGKFQYRGLARSGGLLRMLGWDLIFHDEATNAPRDCERCHAPVNVRRNVPGFPDIVAVRGEDLWFIELKASRGSLTEHQKMWLDALRNVKRVHVALRRPEDFDRIMQEMR